LTAPVSFVAAVLAAGRSSRFGGDKLLHPLRGKPLAAHIADTLAAMPGPRLHRLAVCPANSARAEIFDDRGFEIVVNPDPGLGLSSSLALAAQRALALNADALLVCLADMPEVTAVHLQALIGALIGSDAVATACAGVRSPPAIFARNMLTGLTALTGDTGARDLLRSAATVEAAPDLVRDYDTPSDFG
jgi:molybdenum cofactor cytidylyltransferase